MREHVITVSPHIRRDGTRHPNAFEARIAGSEAVLCVSETPLLSAARALLAAGQAGPDDLIVMRHAGSDTDALRAKVGVAAGLTLSDPAGGRRIALRRWEEFARVRSRITQTASPAPKRPEVEKPLYGAAFARRVGGAA